jgi:hypothetical protein
MVTTVQTIKDAIQWIHCEHKTQPIQYVYMSSQIPNAYELFDRISIAPVQMVDECESSQTGREIRQMYRFYKGRILVVDKKEPRKHKASSDIHWLVIE